MWLRDARLGFHTRDKQSVYMTMMHRTNCTTNAMQCRVQFDRLLLKRQQGAHENRGSILTRCGAQQDERWTATIALAMHRLKLCRLCGAVSLRTKRC